MSSYSGVARVLAPKYFVLLDVDDEERGFAGLMRSRMLTLDAGEVLPVFTSPEAAGDFAEAYCAAGDRVRTRIGQTDALVLAGLCDAADRVGVEAFVFDPVATSVGRWTGTRGAMPVGYYGRFAAELSSGLEELTARAEAALGRNPEDPQNPERVRAWCEERVEEEVEDAHARAAEWEEREGPRPRS